MPWRVADLRQVKYRSLAGRVCRKFDMNNALNISGSSVPRCGHASDPAYCRCDGTASSVPQMSSTIADDQCASLASTRIADACQLAHWSNERMYHASMFTLARVAGRQFVPGCEVPVADVGERDKPFQAIFDQSGNGSGLHEKQAMLKSSPRVTDDQQYAHV
jgi:hypothetical protein